MGSAGVGGLEGIGELSTCPLDSGEGAMACGVSIELVILLGEFGECTILLGIGDLSNGDAASLGGDVGDSTKLAVTATEPFLSHVEKPSMPPRFEVCMLPQAASMSAFATSCGGIAISARRGAGCFTRLSSKVSMALQSEAK